MVDLSTLETEIVTDLTSELENADENFSADLLATKVKNAVKDVYFARKYPVTYTETQIVADFERFYSTIRKIALYDYGTVGMEGNISRNENGVSVNLVDRNSLFKGVIPLSTF